MKISPLITVIIILYIVATRYRIPLLPQKDKMRELENANLQFSSLTV